MILTGKLKIGAIVFFMIIACIAFTQCSNNKKIQEAMEKEVAIINAQCPVMLNEATRLDNCEVLAPNVFRYNYTMLSLTLDTDTALLKKNIEPGMVSLIKTQATMEPYRKEGIVFQYRYKDLSGNYLFQINIGPNEYN